MISQINLKSLILNSANNGKQRTFCEISDAIEQLLRFM